MAYSRRIEDGNEYKHVKSIDKALGILRLFDYNHKSLSQSEVAARLGLPTTTAFRLLNALLENGFLKRDADTGQYMLGSAIYYLGQVARASISLQQESRDVLKWLRDQTGETSHVFIRDGIYRICLDQEESRHMVKMTAMIGQKDLLWVGANGRVLIAFCSDQEREELYHQMVEMWPTIEINALKMRVDRVREAGVARKVDEWNRNCACIAAPIWGVEGKLEGSLSISVPDFRFPLDDTEYVNLVLKGAAEISRRMGYREGTPKEYTLGHKADCPDKKKKDVVGFL